MILNIDNIDKSYTDKKVLFSVTKRFPESGVVGLIGPNGAGKSTLMKIITGYLLPDAGFVEVLGMRVSIDDVSTKRMIGYLPEHNPLYLDMYVREYLSFVAESFGIDRHVRGEAVMSVVSETGLTEVAHKRIGDLSKGYRQRVGIAAAVIHNPRILILDEPTTGLDPNQLVEIRDLIVRLGKEKLVIFSTHIMSEVEQLCSEIIILNKGHIVADGKREELLRNHSSIEELFRQITN